MTAALGALEIILAVYLTTAIFAVVMTYREQRQIGLTCPLRCVAGLTASVVWPLSIGLMLTTFLLRMK